MNKEQEEFNEINNIVSKTINILSDEDFCKLWEYILNKRHTLNAINRTIEIIKQQPTEDDSWILDRLDDFKYLLKGDKDE